MVIEHLRGHKVQGGYRMVCANVADELISELV